MSIAPPGYSTDETDPGSASRPADELQYEFKSVQALRGRARSAKAKWQAQGWELVSEDGGALRTELHFRRVKPTTFGARVLSLVATFRRLPPKTRSGLVASFVLILVTGAVAIAAGTQREAAVPQPSAAQTAAPAEPAVTATAADEPLAGAEPSETSERSERRARRARARARAARQRREKAIRLERRRNTELLQSGVTCADLGQTDILVIPGAEIDADKDGVGCES